MILIVWSLKALRENPLKFFDYQFSNSVQDEVNDLLANGVVTSGIVIGSIFFACDELLRVEELAVGASANLIWKRKMKQPPITNNLHKSAPSQGINRRTHLLSQIPGIYGVTEVNSPMTVGSRSTNTALGTCLPAPVSLKKVLKESSPPPIVLSLGIWPSGWMPCSRQ